MQINGMSAESLQASMAHETQCKKCCIAIGSIVHLVFAGVIGLIYALWWANANSLQSHYNYICVEAGGSEDECDTNQATLYVVGPLLYFIASFDSQKLQNELWTDWSQALDYAVQIEQECGVIETEDVDNCWLDGNRWSKIFALCGVTMILLAANSGLMILGAWSFHARGLAACCGSLCCCLNLAAIITTGVFRYNTWGNFSALCEGPSKYDSSNEYGVNNDRTYSGDAELIVALWIC